MRKQDFQVAGVVYLSIFFAYNTVKKRPDHEVDTNKREIEEVIKNHKISFTYSISIASSCSLKKRFYMNKKKIKNQL